MQTNTYPAPNIIIQQAYLAYKNIALFNDFNLTISANKCTCLLGPSGVGKSTLLRMIANLMTTHTQFKGNIYSDNNRPLVQQISYMAQTDLLMPWLSALDNTLLSFKLQNKLTPQIIQRAEELLKEVGLQKVMHHYPNELSGGMRQRVALVRTLLQDKPIVLMDEPFSNLDAITRFQLQTLASTLLKNKTVLLITHDPLEALLLADEIYILSGRPAVLSQPVHLTSATPRDLSDPDVVAYQAILFHALLQAKENSV